MVLPLNPSVSEPGSMALTSSRGPKASPAHERVLLSTRKFKRGPKPKGGTVKDLIDLAEIKAKFHLPRHMAAHELGISDTCMKRCAPHPPLHALILPVSSLFPILIPLALSDTAFACHHLPPLTLLCVYRLMRHHGIKPWPTTRQRSFWVAAATVKEGSLSKMT